MAGGTLPPGGGSAAPAGFPARRLSSVESDSLLPKYDPQSSLAKREAARSRSAENAIHLIPVFLIICAMILWFFSNSPQVTVVSKVDPVLLPVEGRGKLAETPPSGSLPAADAMPFTSNIGDDGNADDGGD